MKETTIDVSLMPEVWLTWKTTKGTFFLNCNTGKKQTEMPFYRYDGSGRRMYSSGAKLRFAYVKYHEDIEMLELAEVSPETTRKEEVKAWKYNGSKYFLAKDKSVYDKDGNRVTSGFNLSRYHVGHDFKAFLSLLIRIEVKSNADEFKKFLGSNTYTVGSGRIVEVKCTWHIQEWYKTSQKVRNAGKAHKLTDKLTAMEVTDISELESKYPAEHTSVSYNNQGIIYFERLKDGWSVLRMIPRTYGSNPKLIEKERMYIHDSGAYRIASNTNGKWFPSAQDTGYHRYAFVNKDEAMAKCARLKYVLPLIDDEIDSKLKKAIINIVRFPEIEQMIKLGYKKPAKIVMCSNTPKADLKHMFGEYYAEKEKAILRKVGLTKHQFDKHMSSYMSTEAWYARKYEIILAEMRELFGDELKHLDDDSFDSYYDGFVSIYRGYGRRVFPNLGNIDVDRARFIKNAFRLGKKNPNVYTVLDDTLDSYARLNAGTHPEINWYFDSYSDVVRAHDAIDEIKRMQDAERMAIWNKAEAERMKREEEKRKEVDEKRKKYEYEDDSYVIRLPKDSNEIIREGSMQRICIGGYTSRHALGQTNLFFLRRKSNPETPFYAIEMNNTNNIVQIHGYCNKWLGCNPEAIPTVVRWLRKNGIKCNEKILTCAATGYGMVNAYVPMPVVD